MVHGQLSDLNEVDYEIKENVVKLKTKKQLRLKKVSKVISYISKMLKIYALIGVIFIIIFIFATPFICQKIEIHENKIIFIEDHIGYDEKNDTYYDYYTQSSVYLEEGSNDAQLFNQLKDYSHVELIIGVEILLILLLVYMIVFYLLNETIQYLFKNISSKSTPFTFINMMHIRHMTKYLLVLLICHTCIKLLIILAIIKTWIFSIDIMQIIYILSLVCLSYIFEYGYQIQLDSNGVIYEEA